MALALMPRDKVLSAFDEIQCAARDLPGVPMEQLLKYFDNSWMPKVGLWNISGFDSRTNNTCEGSESCLSNE